MTERGVLPFPAPDSGDDALEAQLATLYGSTPPASAEQIARCAQFVRDHAARPGRLSPSAKVATAERREPGASGSGARWWWGAAAAALLVTATTFLIDSDSTRDTSPLKGHPDVAMVDALRGSVTELADNDVRFELTLDTDVQQVAIVGDFNGWDDSATPMSRNDGAWSARIPLAPGRHVYAFVVDGERWVVDPMAPQVPSDGFGPTNAVVIDRGPL